MSNFATFLQDVHFLFQTASWTEIIIWAIPSGLLVGFIRFFITNIVLLKSSGVKSELKKFAVFSGIGFIASLALFVILHYI